MFFHWTLDEYLEYGDLPIYVNSVSPGEQQSNQLHDHVQCFELTLITGGEGVHWVTPLYAPVSRGDLLIVPPKVLHGYGNSETLKLKNIVFQPSSLAMSLLDAADMPFFRKIFTADGTIRAEDAVQPILHLDNEHFTQISALFDKIQNEFESTLPGRQFIMLSLLMQILLELSRIYSMEEVPFKQLYLIGSAVEYMQKNYAKPITMEQVSKASGVSRRNLFRYFKTTINCTPLEYLTRLRLQKALELIQQSDLSLGEIALRCGFYDSNYLSKKFAAKYGIPPGQFRKQQMQKSLR